MSAGEFDVDLPTEPPDSVGRLACSLRDLGATLARKLQETRLLLRMIEQANRGLAFEEVMERVYDGFRILIPYDRIGVALLEQSDTVVRAHWCRTTAGEAKLGAGYNEPLSRSSLGKVLKSAEPRIINDLQAYLEQHPDSDSTSLMIAEGMRSSLTCPLIARGRPMGFLFFSCKRRAKYTGEHVELMREIAAVLSTIFEKGRLYDEVLRLDAERGRYLGTVAHDLKSPVAIVEGYASLLAGGVLGGLSEEQRAATERIRTVCHRMTALVGDLVDARAIESGHLKLELQEVDFARFLQERFETDWFLASQKGLELLQEVVQPLAPIRMDPHRVGQVLDNLLGNAVKFSPPNKGISVRAEPLGGMLQVAVRDQGEGIPEQHLERVFGEFDRAGRRDGDGESGAGLGLAIVKRIVEAHGGRVWAESKPGQGTTVTFALPFVV